MREMKLVVKVGLFLGMLFCNFNSVLAVELIITPRIMSEIIRMTDRDYASLTKWTRGVEENVRMIRGRYWGQITDTSKRHGLDPELVLAIIVVESAGDPGACSTVMACGLMQVKRIVARDVGRPNADLKHPWWNLFVGTRYLAKIRQDYELETTEEVLLGYRLGPSAAVRRISRGFDPNGHMYIMKVRYAWKVARGSMGALASNKKSPSSGS